MIATDEEALICDLAETYGIFDYRALPVKLVATLSVGLRENSRIRMKLNGAKIRTDTTLLAYIADKLSWLVWANTEDAQNGLNHPKSILSMLTGEMKDEDALAFDTAEDFEEARKELIKKVKENG